MGRLPLRAVSVGVGFSRRAPAEAGAYTTSAGKAMKATMPLQDTSSASHEHRTQPALPPAMRSIITFQSRPHRQRLMNGVFPDSTGACSSVETDMYFPP